MKSYYLPKEVFSHPNGGGCWRDLRSSGPTPGDLEMLRSEAETVINNGSVVYGNVIGGNNAGEISSNFIENSIHERSLSAGDTQWSHTVFMPIGNTFKSFSVSANGTDINHTVNTDLLDNNTHTLGTAANSQSFTDDAADSDED